MVPNIFPNFPFFDGEAGILLPARLLLGDGSSG